MEIKFKAWYPKHKTMYDPRTLTEILDEAWDTGSADGAVLVESQYDHLVWLQFTGRQDIKGAEYYEQDWFKYPNSNFGYGDPSQPEYLIGKVPSIDGLIEDGESWLYRMNYGELICNYYENPELEEVMR